MTDIDIDPARLPTARRLFRLSRFMDSSIRLPGGFRIGWDGIIGLIPGVGDLVGLAVSAWIVVGAARLGAPRTALLRMAANVGIETLLGTIPVLGDVFDLAFKANNRNMRLLERSLLSREEADRRSRQWFLLWVIAAVVLVVLFGWLIVTVLSLVVSAVLGLVS